jgi:hypothetical protein
MSTSWTIVSQKHKGMFRWCLQCSCRNLLRTFFQIPYSISAKDYLWHRVGHNKKPMSNQTKQQWQMDRMQGNHMINSVGGPSFAQSGSRQWLTTTWERSTSNYTQLQFGKIQSTISHMCLAKPGEHTTQRLNSDKVSHCSSKHDHYFTHSQYFLCAFGGMKRTSKDSSKSSQGTGPIWLPTDTKCSVFIP